MQDGSTRSWEVSTWGDTWPQLHLLPAIGPAQDGGCEAKQGRKSEKHSVLGGRKSAVRWRSPEDSGSPELLG